MNREETKGGVTISIEFLGPVGEFLPALFSFVFPSVEGKAAFCIVNDLDPLLPCSWLFKEFDVVG